MVTGSQSTSTNVYVKTKKYNQKSMISFVEIVVEEKILTRPKQQVKSEDMRIKGPTELESLNI